MGALTNNSIRGSKRFLAEYRSTTNSAVQKFFGMKEKSYRIAELSYCTLKQRAIYFLRAMSQAGQKTNISRFVFLMNLFHHGSIIAL